MSTITITYNQHDARNLSSIFATLPPYLKEISTKKCLWMIQSLVSRSFEYSTEVQTNKILSLFANLPVWIKHGLKSVEQFEVQPPISDQSGNLIAISFGYFMSNLFYSWNKQIQNSPFLRWTTNVKHKYMAIQYKTKELRLNQDCLEQYFILINSSNGIYKIILPLKAPPRCYVMPRYRGQYYERTLDFEKIDASCLADSSAVCLQFHNEELLANCMKFLMQVIKLDRHTAQIKCAKMSAQACDFSQSLFDFWSNYAFQMVLALGYRIKCQIKPNTLKKIERLSYRSRGQQYANHACYLKLIALYYRARHNHFFDINEKFDNIKPMSSSVILDKWEYVPRIYLTPYGVYPLPIKPMRGNRILRERELFGPGEHFCRVIIRDIDLGQPQQDFMKANERWIKNLLVGCDDITVGNRKFLFLLCSNSQLRDRSFWFHASYNNCEAEDIRKWMGDFSREKCVGTRIARMALSLTGTTATIKLLPHQMERIADKKDLCNREFTDGIGKISRMALREALMKYNPELIEDNYMPCVIQARLNGIKGVFVLAPDLDDKGILIQYRASQHKFDTNHNVLEIVKHASSGMAFLNRQVIVILENMGVEEHIFLKLQNKARMKISMSLLANKSAQRTLEQHVRCYDWERMRKSGVQLTREPFARSLLLLLANERLQRLKQRSHVQISLSDGRMLLGTVDETNSLRYGQVFIQLRDLDGKSQIINNQKILVTKNPAHFPGDIRKLDAVDCPALHHYYECIVFPAEGPRPHPNEISGSDLDGDEYWVCWDEDLVNSATKQHEPANFDSAGKTKHPGEITIDVIADFLFKYLSSDSLGALSNRHLACCAQYKPDHEYSLILAEIISQAVDFPKTGILPKVPTHIKIDKYPDFMENQYKDSFVSDSSIGTMYRQVKEVWKIHSTWQDKLEEKSVPIDQNLLKRGYKNFIAEAEEDYQYYTSRINNILSIYNLPNEYELITGCHSCAEEEKKNNDSAETASLEFRHLLNEMRDRFAENDLRYTDKLCKASAWYYVAYNAGVTLSFGWIMNRLMSDIIKQNRLPQEEHQALKRIGETICNHGLDMTIRGLAASFNIVNEDYTNVSETEALGRQFLDCIELCNGLSEVQIYAHTFLIWLHKIALDIL